MSTVVRIFLLSFLMAQSSTLWSQSQDTTFARYDEIMGIVSLYQYMLNTVGSETTPTSEKETIINASYLKIFRDTEVQIEDDLLEGRSVILNKSASAYLRDIDFFFQSVNFSFSDIRVDSAQNETGETYFRVSFTSQLAAIDLDNNAINRTYDRYLEVNQTEKAGLKIVSIYTTEQDPDSQLISWWAEMDPAWQQLLIGLANLDSVGIDELKFLVALDSLDLSMQFQIDDISPLSEMRQLRYLNLSQTGVKDLLPIRYASNLISLNLSFTAVDNLEVLRYFKKLKKLEIQGCHLLDQEIFNVLPQVSELNISETALLDFAELARFQKLTHLNVSGTSLNSTDWLSSMVELQWIDLSKTGINQIELSRELFNLKKMDVSNTYISSVDFISYLPALTELSVEYTQVADLSPSVSHPALRKVFADFSLVKNEQVSRLMKQRKSLLILTDTDLLIAWWNELPDNWKNTLIQKQGWKKMPTIEHLVTYLQVDSLDLSGSTVSDSKPLQQFKQLRYLNLSETNITSLAFLVDLEELRYLDISNTPTAELLGIQHCKWLSYLNVNDTPIKSIGLLSSFNSIKQLYIHRTQVPEVQLDEFVSSHPEVQVIYRTEELQSWWDNLSPKLKSQLQSLMGAYSVENLHQLVIRPSLELSGVEISDFEDITAFRFLRRLSISQVDATYLPDLSAFKSLDSLSWIRSPLITLEPIKNLTQLKYLDISSTAVDDLSPLSSLNALQGINCAGTQVKTVKDIRNIESLKYLNISNTRVWQLNWLYDIRDIETLICFNSRVSDRQLDQFKAKFPACEITSF